MAGRYQINLYNKDADAFTNVTTLDDCHLAIKICNDLAWLVQKGMIIDRTVKDHEPFDWVEVYNTEEKRVICVK